MAELKFGEKYKWYSLFCGQYRVGPIGNTTDKFH